ncbi:MAG TPA: hypothetical protein VFW87_14330 [Pirellulales bacterium]|nr:hypothetical protein [Pirellulales bacterium]
MSLADDIRKIEGCALVGLDSSHDYHTYTKRVWRLVQEIANEGRTFSYRNPATGTKVDEQSLLGRSQLYITEYLTASTFQQFVLLFEDFVFDLLRSWLAAYPASFSSKQVSMAEVLKAPDISAIVSAAIDKELNDLKYKRVAEWFSYLARLAQLGCPDPSEIEQIAEIKASRDVLVHNHGVANATYVSKAGASARFKEGEKLLIPEPYHRASWQAIRDIVRKISAAAVAKAPPGGS